MTRTPMLRGAMCTAALMLVGLALLTGCQPSLTKPVRDSIRSVSISKDVKIRNYIESGFGSGYTGDAREQLKAAMRENRINVAQIVWEQFETELVKAKIFPAIVPEGGDAEVRLEALFNLVPVSGRGKPVLWVTSNLVLSDGTVAWKRVFMVFETDPRTPAYAWQEYVRTPELLREAITVAAQLASTGLMSSLQRK